MLVASQNLRGKREKAPSRDGAFFISGLRTNQLQQIWHLKEFSLFPQVL